MIQYAQKTDEELIRSIAAGDTAAMDFLMEKYKNLVRLKAKTLFLIGADKDDLIQEGMIGLYKAIRDFDEEKEASFRHFAELCMMRQMYSAIKRSNTQKNQPLNNYVSIDKIVSTELTESEAEPLGELSPEKLTNPEELVIDKVTTGMVEEMLANHLSGMEKKVLDYYRKDYSYSRIAELLGKEPKAVDNAMQRIRKKLQQVLQELKV